MDKNFNATITFLSTKLCFELMVFSKIFSKLLPVFHNIMASQLFIIVLTV
jgi:hypothetical protein